MKKKESDVINKVPNSSQLQENDVGGIASYIFGIDSLSTILTVDPLNEEVTQKSIIQNSNVWIHRILDNIEPSLSAAEKDTRPGRIGVAQVRFDSSSQQGTLIMSKDRLHAQAQSNFSSVKANVCLFSGKWQYEIQLESKGVMQFGWSMSEDEFTPETGVGDSMYSYSFDGNRVRKWNLVTSEYGEAWQVGDIIGCTIDLDIGSIHFYRNGRDLGEAFSGIPLGPGFAYFPAISLAMDEKVQGNYGSLPFKFPVESYQPVQQPPTGAVLQTNQLLHWFSLVSSIPKIKSIPKSKQVNKGNKVTSEAACLIFCELLIKRLACLWIKPYVIESCIVPYLHDTTDNKVSSDSKSLHKLNYFCDALMAFLQPEDFMDIMNGILKCLIHTFNQTSVSLEYTEQKQSLVLFCDLCQNTNTRQVLLKQPAFIKAWVPELMNLQPIDVMVLKESVPQAWWSDKTKGKIKEYDTRKKIYFRSCKEIKSKTIDLEKLQEVVLMVFLNNTDGSTTQPSSRKCFLHMFRTFLKENHLTGLVSLILSNQPLEPIPLPVAHSLFHRLVSTLRCLWERELPHEPVHVPVATFYDGVVDYFSIDRVGGVLSYLVNTFRPALTAELGDTHEVLTNNATLQPARPLSIVQVRQGGLEPRNPMFPAMSRWVTLDLQSLSAERDVDANRTPSVAPGVVDNSQSLYQLLDGIIMLYTVAAHKQIHKISTLRDDMDKYITALNEAKARLTLAKETCPEAAVEINISIETFEKKIEEQSRVLMAWIRGAIYTPEKRANLVWLLRAVMLTLETASARGDLFSFVPDFYIEAIVELCTALRNYFHPTLPIEDLTGHKQLLIQVAEFLVKHLADPRVVNLGSKDTIVEALAGYIAKKPTMECLETINQESQERLVSILVKPYDNRPWGQTNWILMRMWQGCGFAFRYQRSPHLSRRLGPRTPSSDSGLLIHQTFEPCPSYQYQRLVADYLLNNNDVAAEFINSVLKQLNWSFSEFISMMQEIQNLSKRPERVIIDARQLKICSTCFDFVISLLRVLEMLCTTCRQVFTDINREGAENLLERLCQLLSQILLRVTTPTGCFAHVISLEVPDLDVIDQFPILAAVVGVLVALLADDIANTSDSAKMSSAAKSFLSEPAFQISCLKYVLGQAEQSNQKQEIFSFLNYPQTVRVSEVATVSQLITLLAKYQTRMGTTKDNEDEDELCPICCAMPLAVIFLPCNHRSCKSCITHHLMDCKECFFCKAVIKSVVGSDGKMLFDSSTTKIPST